MVRCFLVGAGASYAIGQRSNVEVPTDSSFFRILQSVDSVLYDNIERILKSQFSSIQELQSLSLEAVEDYADKIDVLYKRQLTSELRKSIFILLGERPNTTDKSILQLLRSGRVRKPNLQLYNLILDNITRGDFFVTLNYDILLDLAVLSAGKSIYYGDHMRSVISADEWPYSTANPISLFKPHGSLNWGELGSPFPHVIDPVGFRIATRLSIVGDEMLINIWREAEQTLARADELIIIGSSLSKQDQHLMQFIHFWKSKASPSDRRTKIIFRQEEHMKYYEKVLSGPNGKLDFYPHGFDEKSIDFIFD